MPIRSPIPWNASMSIGDARLDDQRRELIDIVNLIGATADTGRTDAARGLINQLLNTSRVHFRDEERELQAAGFPDLILHIREHERLMEQVVTLAGLVERDGITPRMMQLLQDWLIEHLVEHDKASAAFLATRPAD